MKIKMPKTKMSKSGFAVKKGTEPKEVCKWSFLIDFLSESVIFADFVNFLIRDGTDEHDVPRANRARQDGAAGQTRHQRVGNRRPAGRHIVSYTTLLDS